MTILDICEHLDRQDDDGVIYARRVDGDFTPTSEALVAAALQYPGFDYCLEVSIAKEAVTVWSRWRDGQRPTPVERAEAVCYKANNDAWGPPNFPV